MVRGVGGSRSSPWGPFPGSPQRGALGKGYLCFSLALNVFPREHVLDWVPSEPHLHGEVLCIFLSCGVLVRDHQFGVYFEPSGMRGS